MLQNNIWEVYRDKGVQVLGLNYKESPATVLNWIDLLDLTFPNLLDSYGSIYSAYGDGYIPYNVVLDQDFTVKYTAHGYSEPSIINHVNQNLPDVFVVLDPDSYSFSKGTPVGFDITLTNDTSSNINFDVWIDAILPGHAEFGGNPIGMKTLTLPPYGSITRHVTTMPIPGAAPTDDQYWLRAQVGDFGVDVWTSDIFNFEVTP